MNTFERHLVVPVPKQLLYDWHMREGAFERLSAPWQAVRQISSEGVSNGSKRVFEVKKGGLWLRWVAEHQKVVPDIEFTDVQQQGPFKRWEHRHRFDGVDPKQSELTDRIEYELPAGVLGRVLAGGSVQNDLDKMFVYRHRTTLGDLTAHGRYLGRGHLKIAISGASGLIGRQMVAYFRTGGHEVLRFVRRKKEPGPDEIRWSTEGGVEDMDRLEGVNAIIHLAGANVGQRWTPEAQKEILDSRVLGTRSIVEAIGRLEIKPSVLVAASAVGFYGDTGQATVGEEAPLGKGFLAEVCNAWETEARLAEAHCRTVRMRIGVVLDPRGGALGKLLPIFKAGMGGPVGGGRQLLSWVGLDDVLDAFHTAVRDPELHGPVNVTGPEPVSQAELAKTLGRILNRPAFAPAPAAAIKLMYGDMGEETVLASTGARPVRLLERGYQFRAPTLELALRHALGRDVSQAD